jgi:hypothetical protein
MDKYYKRVVQFNEKEPATNIDSILMLKLNYVKTFVFFPILSVCTLLILPVAAYWYPVLQEKLFFSKEDHLPHATHLFITNGTEKKVLKIQKVDD